MKTIEIMSKDQRDYTINIFQITCLHEFTNENGTLISLSCGTKIKTATAIHDLKEMIKKAS
ncbi:hypothetical protein EKL32_27255 [Flavobacterium sp. GSN2]|nr:hypothetical protein EKL32_27255 [Flavobacterium sp. GSN2]